jgi:predicted transcriptional regulator
MTTEQLFDKIRALLDEVPGQSVKELATKLNVNRTFLAGYLQAMEDQGYVSSRSVGPARMYYNREKSGVKG